MVQTAERKTFWVLTPEKAGKDPLVLLDTRVEVEVKGKLAAVKVTQTFRNPLKKHAEINCLFPLPHQAAILDYQIKIGARTIQARIEEIEKADRVYQQARAEGKHAALLRQERVNLFRVYLANVTPGETIEAVLSYEEPLKFADGEYEFVLPMGLTPRYSSPDHPEEAAQVNFPTAKPGSEIGPVSIDVRVDAGVPVADPTSPSHPLVITRQDGGVFLVHLDGSHIPDHDFVLRYSLAWEKISAAAWTSGRGDTHTFVATLVPPALPEGFTPPAREFIFILDRSGSMSGSPIEQARNALRACIRALEPGDTFRLLTFDNVVEWYGNGEAIPVRQEEIDRADRFLEEIDGRGGTEILGAIQAVLGLAPDPERSRMIVFLTDGAVSAEERVIKSLRAKLGSARLFTFGIGSSVNRALLQSMAETGRGTAEFLQLHEDIEGAIMRFQDRVSFPMLTNLSMETEGIQSWDLYPSMLPDLNAGDPLEITGRYRRIPASTSARVKFSGSQNGQEVTFAVDLPDAVGQDTRIERHWARRRIEDLQRKLEAEPNKAAELRGEIIGLALQHRLVTRFTTFVAVDDRTTHAGGESVVLHVAQPLPAGMEWDGFFGGGVNQDPGIAFNGGRSVGMKAFMPSMASPSQTFPAFLKLSRKSPSAGSRVNDSDLDPNVPLTKYYDNPGPAETTSLDTPEQLQRWLARTQQVDGSWNGDVEWTSAALLVYLRSGHTNRSGSYRAQVKRAAAWLAGQQTHGWVGAAAVLALNELAAATRQEGHQKAASDALRALAAPSGPLEGMIHAAIAGKPPTPDRLDALSAPEERLRAAALVRIGWPDARKEIQAPGMLDQIWLAVLELG